MCKPRMNVATDVEGYHLSAAGFARQSTQFPDCALKTLGELR